MASTTVCFTVHWCSQWKFYFRWIRSKFFVSIARGRKKVFQSLSPFGGKFAPPFWNAARLLGGTIAFWKSRGKRSKEQFAKPEEEENESSSSRYQINYFLYRWILELFVLNINIHSLITDPWLQTIEWCLEYWWLVHYSIPFLDWNKYSEVTLPYFKIPEKNREF